ncbi:MAG: hypothetical protein R3F15_04590 [Lysobacterales bacterium]
MAPQPLLCRLSLQTRSFLQCITAIVLSTCLILDTLINKVSASIGDLTMRKLLFHCSLAVCLMALSPMLMAQSSTDEPEEIVATLQDVEGLVLLKVGEESVPAFEGQKVRVNQEVLVTEGAKAILVFNDSCDLMLDVAEVYSVPSRSPCSTLWWTAPAAAGVACAGAHASSSSNSRSLAAVGMAVGTGLLTAAQGREEEYSEFAAALERSQGEVLARNEQGVLEAIRPGTRLRADQELVVRDGAKALIRFDDGCTKAVEVGERGEESFRIPPNSPCFSPGLWWASSAAAVGTCITVEDETDRTSP